MSIPDGAVEAAAECLYWMGPTAQKAAWKDSGHAVQTHYRHFAEQALEAALPILLSHEREETRLAHLDAVVNAATVDRLERELAQAKADGWDDGRVITEECGEFVSWWDGEYEGQCELPDGHEGHHYDGVSCYDGHGDEVYDCKEHA